MIITIDATDMFCSEGFDLYGADMEANELASRLSDAFPDLDKITEVDISGDYCKESGIWDGVEITLTCTGYVPLSDIKEFLTEDCEGCRSSYYLIQ